MTSVTRTFLLGSVFAVAGLSAQAATLSATELLQQYNLITKGDAYSSQEVEGNIYIGGDLNGGTLQYAFKSQGDPSLPNPDLAQLVVHGDNNGVTINPTKGTTIVIGGENKGTVTGNEADRTVITGSVPADLVPNKDDVFATLDQASADLHEQGKQLELDGLLANYAEGEQGYTFGAGVYELSFDLLSKKEFTLDLAEGETAIFNVSGDSAYIQKNFMGLNGDYSVASQVIWNFYEATEITFDSKFVGTLLAPNAVVKQFTGSFEGSVYASEVSMTNGEIHYQGFDDGVLPEVAPVPLPAAAPLLLAGLGGLAMLRRKRKAA